MYCFYEMQKCELLVASGASWCSLDYMLRLASRSQRYIAVWACQRSSPGWSSRVNTLEPTFFRVLGMGRVYFYPTHTNYLVYPKNWVTHTHTQPIFTHFLFKINLSEHDTIGFQIILCEHFILNKVLLFMFWKMHAFMFEKGLHVWLACVYVWELLSFVYALIYMLCCSKLWIQCFQCIILNWKYWFNESLVLLVSIC